MQGTWLQIPVGSNSHFLSKVMPFFISLMKMILINFSFFVFFILYRCRLLSKEFSSPSTKTWWLDSEVGNFLPWIWKTLFQTTKALSTYGMVMKIGLCQLRCNAISLVNFHGFNSMSYRDMDTLFQWMRKWVKLSWRNFLLGRSSPLCNREVFFSFFLFFCLSLVLKLIFLFITANNRNISS